MGRRSGFFEANASRSRLGLATYPADGRTATDLIAAADRALYRVKRGGGHDAAGPEGGST